MGSVASGPTIEWGCPPFATFRTTEAIPGTTLPGFLLWLVTVIVLITIEHGFAIENHLAVRKGTRWTPIHPQPLEPTSATGIRGFN